MLFNSYEFIFAFLPVTLALYFVFNHASLSRMAQLWLVIASLIFYTWWNFTYIFVIIISIFMNYLFGQALLVGKKSPTLLALGCGADLVLLGYYKYTDFIIVNINNGFGWDIPLLQLSLPLAISFFTFQQIAFLVDCYRGEVKKIDLLEYFLFVLLFCQLIAGPIVTQKEMIPQFEDPEKRKLNYRNISAGLFLFFCGLTKKVVLADTLSTIVNNGFDSVTTLTSIDAWIVSLSYTMQLYFDFSGYVDMATGIALMLNIQLPVNFLSPYRSTNISEFWRRWHITLGRFLREYLYIPLGGSRISFRSTMTNIIITFLLCGIWHGAGWLFFIWGIAHGFAVVIHRLWTKSGNAMHPLLGGLITFIFVNSTWVIFRATNLSDAIRVLKIMFFPDFQSVSTFIKTNAHDFSLNFLTLIVSFIIVFFLPNSHQLLERFQPRFVYLVYITAAFAVSFALMEKQSPFLYWQF